MTKNRIPRLGDSDSVQLVAIYDDNNGWGIKTTQREVQADRENEINYIVMMAACDMSQGSVQSPLSIFKTDNKTATNVKLGQNTLQ